MENLFHFNKILSYVRKKTSIKFVYYILLRINHKPLIYIFECPYFNLKYAYFYHKYQIY